jgi:hypothetical protein
LRLFNRHALGIVVSALLLCSCGSNYSLKTLPDDAEIKVGDQLIGKSPANFSAGALPDAAKKAGGYLVRVAKPGYKSLWVWLPNSGRDYSISLNLLPFFQRDGKSSVLGQTSAASPDDLNLLTDTVLFLQDNLLNGDKVEAALVDQTFAANPLLASAHYLKALQSLRKNAKDEANAFLSSAILYAPLEGDFQTLKNELKAKK